MKIAIVGAGIIGITAAITLLEDGFDVTIFTKDQPLKTNSDAAIAIWHAPNNRKKQLQQLCLDSLPKFYELSKLPASGVQYINTVLYFSNQEAYKQSSWIKHVNPTTDLPSATLKKDAYPYAVMVQVPIADVNIYRPFLLNALFTLNGKLEIKKVTLEELTEQYDIVINCAGWETIKLRNDPRVYPIRGQSIITNTPVGFKDHPSIVASNADAYIVFRPQSNECVLGTTYQKNDLNASISKSDFDEILDKVSDFFPYAKTLNVKNHKIGFRCGRSDVCIKIEQITNTIGKKIPLIHCYGHSGSGYSASWGSAYKTLEYCKEIGAKL